MSRSTYYTKKNKKRYLKRNKKGQIIDNQSYKRAHTLDIKKKSKAEKQKKKGR